MNLPDSVPTGVSFPRFDGSQACAGAGDWWWSEEPGTGHAARAKAVCAGCTFLTECRDWALVREEFGIWGGTTPQERKQWRHERGLKIAGWEEDELAVWRPMILRLYGAGWKRSEIVGEVPLNVDQISRVWSSR